MIVSDIIKKLSSLWIGWDLENTIYFVLDTFKDSLFARNQSAKTSSSLFMFLYRSLISFPLMYMAVSSANNIALLLFRHKDRLFVYKINKSGRRVDPCGTPYVISRGSEVVLLQLTYCFLFVR